jgi:hypothetical protein
VTAAAGQGENASGSPRQLAEAFGGKPAEGAAARTASREDVPFHRALRQRYLRQRRLLIRRTVTMLTAAALIALIALTWTWLTGMQQRAKDIVPPTRIDQTAPAVETPGPRP